MLTALLYLVTAKRPEERLSSDERLTILVPSHFAMGATVAHGGERVIIAGYFATRLYILFSFYFVILGCFQMLCTGEGCRVMLFLRI